MNNLYDKCIFLNEAKKIINLSGDYSDGSYYSSFNIPEFIIQYSKYFKKNGNALDIGCGNGRISKYLVDNFKMKVDAFDPEPKAIEIARENGIDATISNTEDYKFKNNFYDLIVCLNITQHMSKKEQLNLFSNIRKSLKNGGILALSIYETLNNFSVGSIYGMELEDALKMEKLEEFSYEKGSKKFKYYIFKKVIS